VTFTPPVIGARSGTVTITSDAANQPKATVALSGNGVQQAVTVAPLDLPFGQQRVATPSAPSTVTVTNSGSDTLTVGNIVLSGVDAADFALAKLPNLPATLAPGAQFTFDASFTPTVVGV